MYEDLIANLNPKPQFNLKSYKNEDFYSEGEIEDLITVSYTHLTLPTNREG